MQWYNVIFAKLVVWLIPVSLRKAKHFAFLNSLVTPLQQLHSLFLQFRENQLYDLKITGQVIYLELVLNDIFDPVQRRIYIEDGEIYEPPVFYEEYKNQPVIFNEEASASNPIFWNTENIENRINVNFYVWVPSDVVFDTSRMKAVVNKYKVFGRTYEIRII